MRDSQKFALQNKLQDEVLSRIVMIQRWIRAKLIRCHYLQIVKGVMTIQVRKFINCHRLYNTSYHNMEKLVVGYIETKMLLLVKYVRQNFHNYLVIDIFVIITTFFVGIR